MHLYLDLRRIAIDSGVVLLFLAEVYILLSVLEVQIYRLLLVKGQLGHALAL